MGNRFGLRLGFADRLVLRDEDIHPSRGLVGAAILRASKTQPRVKKVPATESSKNFIAATIKTSDFFEFVSGLIPGAAHRACPLAQMCIVPCHQVKKPPLKRGLFVFPGASRGSDLRASVIGFRASSGVRLERRPPQLGGFTTAVAGPPRQITRPRLIYVIICCIILQHTITRRTQWPSIGNKFSKSRTTLVEQGQSPTLAAVRRALGGGSFTTISEFMAEWRAVNLANSQPIREAAPRAVADRLQELGNEVWAAALELANGRLAAERDSLEAHRVELEHRQAEVAEMADQMAEEIEGLKGRLGQAEARGGELLAQTQELGEQKTHWETEAEKAKALTAEIQNRVDDLRRLLEASEQKVGRERRPSPGRARSVP